MHSLQVYTQAAGAFQPDGRALSLGAASAQTQVAAPARRKTLRGRPGRSELRLALTRLRLYATLCSAKAQVGEKPEGRSAERSYLADHEPSWACPRGPFVELYGR